MEDNLLSDTIESWLDGSLSEADMYAFEMRLASDTDLQEKVALHRRARAEIEDAVFRDYKRKAAVWRHDLDHLPALPPDLVTLKSSRPSWVKWILGASLLLILIAGAFWFLRKTPENQPAQTPQVPVPDVPVAQNESPKTQPDFNPPPAKNPDTGVQQKNQKQGVPETVPANLLAMADEVEVGMRNSLNTELKGMTRGGTESAPEFKQVTEDFFKGDFVKTKPVLKTFAEGVPPYAAQAQKMLADIYFQERNYREAANWYERFAKTSSDPRVEWRLLHFYLKDYSNRKSDFWRLLNQITGQDHKFKSDAEKLKAGLEQAGIRAK